MKKLLSILLLFLLPAITTMGATFNLKVELTPHGAGSLYAKEGAYEEGSKVSLSTYPHTGYVFLGWYEGEEKLSASTSFSYTMPSHDAQVTARYIYDPEVPVDPNSINPSYTVTLECKPEGSGTFNNSRVTMPEGDGIQLYAYSNTGYEFLHWENEKGKVISTSQSFYYVMPHGNNIIYAVFDFNPEPPANPASNYWNKGTGEVIIDDFTPGHLLGAINDVIGDSSNDEVTMITVSGVMNNNDFGITYYYDNCTFYDLSRVTGITEVPSYAFDDMPIEKISLPECIERIGSYAFAGCEHLTSLTLYSMNPPTLGNNVFRNVSEVMVVYVPTAALDRYLGDKDWQNFTIMPLQGNVRNITVTFPEDTNMATFANMTLQLTNIDNGQTISLTTTNKRSYTFNGIPVQTHWMVTLRNQRGVEFGKIENVTVGDEDITVAFTSLKKIIPVSLSVLTPDGRNVTSDTRVSWYTAGGDFIAEGASLSSIPAGEELLYDIKLTGDLRYEYQEQQKARIIVGDNSTPTSVTLCPIPTINFTGCVKSEYGIISGADVVMTQWANGQYSKTTMTKTAQDGTFSINALDDSTKLVISSARFRDVVIQRGRFGADTDFGTLVLNRVTGIVVIADTRTQSVDSESTLPSVTGSVEYSLYNKTTGKDVEDIVVQGRHLIIPSGAKAGDEMTLTVTELSGDYLSASGDLVIADNDTARIQVIIRELGGIEMSFAQSANAANEAFLYDSEGNLQDHADYTGSKASFSHLPAGTYTLVTMGKSLRRGNILRLSDINKIGLQDGRDYASAQVIVKDGETVKYALGAIPLFDEKMFDYTSDDSYVQVNKLSVSTGQYVTLTTRTYFKEEYDSSIGDVKLIVDLPENCEIVDNSLIVGNVASPYIVDENRVVVPLTREQRSERVRLCVIPTIGGTYRLSASVQFDYEGERIQPLGSVYFQTSSMAISVPSSTCQKSVLVSGKAPRQASVEVFDNGTLVAQTDALQNGQWKVNCPLTDVYNLSEHRISAKIHETNGPVLQTESKTVMYDREAVEPLDVTMTFYNAWMKKNISVFFNLKAGMASPSSYSFYHATPITFVANLSNNDSTAVNSVYIHVFTSDDAVTSLKASYDGELNRWVAAREFSPGHLPVSVSVSVDYNSSLAYDGLYERQLIDQAEEGISINHEKYKELELLYDKLDEEIRNDHFNPQIVNATIEKIIQLENSIYGFDNGVPDSIFVNKVNKAQSIDEIIAIIETIDSRFNSLSVNYSNSEISIPSFNFVNGLLSPNIKFVGCGSIPVSDTPELYLQDYMKCFFSGEWNDVDFSKASNGIVTISNQNGGKVVLDFQEIFNNQANGYDHLDSDSIFMERISAYMEEFTNYGMDIEALFMQSINTFRQNVNNYHFALSAIPYVKSQESRSVFKNASRAGFVDGIKAAWNSKWGVGLRGVVKWGGIGWTIVDNGLGINNAMNNDEEWDNTINKIETICGEIGDKLKQISENQQKNDASAAKVLLTTKAIFSGLAIASAFCGPGLFVVGVGFKICAWSLGHANKQRIEKSRNQRLQLVEKMKEDCCPNRKCDDDDPEPDPEPPIPPVQPILDPSGYVYEGVASNRLEGVTATVFYKAQTENMYGDIQESIVKWNAEDYGQVNPQITDDEGRYAWDVPQGQWQVKFEKDGYETTYSDWLPVPPPQLDVNVGMTQARQPEVKEAHAYEDGVELSFDKYMQPVTLTANNITVSQNGEYVKGEVKLLDEEVAYKDESVKYASRVRFIPETPFTAEEVTLVVANRVKSYADIQMQDTYTQTLHVEKEVKEIVADEAVTVPYEGSKKITIQVLPAVAAAGKTLHTVSASDMLASLIQQDIIISETGEAQLEVMGRLPGTTALTFSIDGVQTTAITIINVEIVPEKIVREPQASLASGSSVYRGTTVTLTPDEEGQKIWYTLDGTCPCDENGTRQLYTEPLTINDDVTIKAISEDSEGTASDIVTLTYSILQSKAGIALNDGWTWVSFNMKNDEALASTNTALASGTWTASDVIKDNQYVDMYSAAQGKWIGTMSKHGVLKNTGMYKIHSSQIQTIGLTGEAVHPKETVISVGNGWNYISYVPLVSMSVTDALSGYEAQSGDVIKSQDAFATYTSANGWEGDLTTLDAGKGYMLKRNATAKVTSFCYPMPSVSSTPRNARSMPTVHHYADNMNVVGEITGITVEDGDSLIAYVGGEIRGASQLENGKKVFLTIHGDQNATVALVLQRNGEIIATASDMMEYRSDKVVGTGDSPTAINFFSEGQNANNSIGNIKAIYSINGMKMGTKRLNAVPAGAYIIYSEAGGNTRITKLIKQ